MDTVVVGLQQGSGGEHLGEVEWGVLAQALEGSTREYVPSSPAMEIGKFLKAGTGEGDRCNWRRYDLEITVL